MATPSGRVSGMEVLFVALAIAGLLGTAAQLGPYLKLGFLPGNLQFWKDTLATPASTFIVVDIFVLGAAALVWMFAECRRLGIAARWAWAYFLGSMLIGISFAMPLFFAHRQRRLRLHHPEQVAAPGGTDFLGIALVLGCVLLAVAYSFSHLPA